MNERVCTSNSYMKNVLYVVALAKRRVDIVFCPLFAYVIKNKITSSETHIIVCLSET